MFSKSTRVEILLEAAGPDALVGVSQLWRSYAEHQVARLLDCSARSRAFDLGLSDQQRGGSEFPVSLSLSRHTWGVLSGHGGG